MRNYKFLPEARNEFLEYLKFYNSRQKESGIHFGPRVEEVLNNIRGFPEAGSHEKDGEECWYPISPFPLNLVYLWEEDLIVILALAHQRRRP